MMRFTQIDDYVDPEGHHWPRAVIYDGAIAPLLAEAAEQALREAAADVRRIRTQGLRADEDYGPNSETFEEWLIARADKIAAEQA